MILCHPEIERVFDLSTKKIPSLVVEKPSFFRKLVLDLYEQCDGGEGEFLLSENDVILNMYSNVEFIDNSVHYDFTPKALTTRVLKSLESEAMNEVFHLKTAELLQKIQEYLNELTFSCNAARDFTRCSLPGLLKSAGVTIRDDYLDPLEKLFDYMELVREFDKDRVFVLLNLRSYYEDADVETFLCALVDHKYRAFLPDNVDRAQLPHEERTTIDDDLCEV